MTSTPSSDREKVGAEHAVSLGQLEAVTDEAVPHVLGVLIGNVIEQVLSEPGVELDTLNVTVTPETRSVMCEVEGHACECQPDALVIRAWAERDRP